MNLPAQFYFSLLLCLHETCYIPSLVRPWHCIYSEVSAKPQTYQEYKMQPNKMVVPRPVTRFSSLCRCWLNSGTQIVMFRLFSSRTSQKKTNKKVQLAKLISLHFKVVIRLKVFSNVSLLIQTLVYFSCFYLSSKKIIQKKLHKSDLAYSVFQAKQKCS